ncbi:MAG: bifunctional hydroxymethylpyrimidine kinase/phosphomethylpyrimidine kinase [Deltaproteobacteria bacterium]|nr:bifunctional hydroxymethylpyrimidine kinase/phosphomethylpyrimidine kinase [Deltaproteobacteria bacterium]
MQKTILTIAGADPSGGAGIQRDLKTFEDFGLRGLSVITALTSQNQKRVKAVFPVPAAFVVKQIEVLLEEYSVDVVKLGMLATGDIVLALARLFKKAKFQKIVIDPVLVSSSGYPLLDKKGIILLRERLPPFTTIVTPNLSEAATLAGMKRVSTLEEMKLASVRIKKLGPEFVLVKGGHLKAVNSERLTVNSKKAVDMLYDGKNFKIFEAKRINKDIHGTGCILSSAIAAGMAKGFDIYDAVKKAKIYTTKIINLHTKDFGVEVNRETI